MCIFHNASLIDKQALLVALEEEFIKDRAFTPPQVERSKTHVMTLLRKSRKIEEKRNEEMFYFIKGGKNLKSTANTYMTEIRN